MNHIKNATSSYYLGLCKRESAFFVNIKKSSFLKVKIICLIETQKLKILGETK
jgi:hypothetical protein|tara:strand:- start:224 stop:382 length:159 start_codon:yes stop_codon:yes gene_type:complete